MQDGKWLAKKLCEVLGLNPAQVQRITIDAQAGRIVRVYTERMVSAEESQALADAFTAPEATGQFEVHPDKILLANNE
jgi:hypothetical protein